MLIQNGMGHDLLEILSIHAHKIHKQTVERQTGRMDGRANDEAKE